MLGKYYKYLIYIKLSCALFSGVHVSTKGGANKDTCPSITPVLSFLVSIWAVYFCKPNLSFQQKTLTKLSLLRFAFPFRSQKP